eukprot:CAMPEP_0184864552 /NCGR_PEP_ID=MMETSP0580-20130426/15385_1 /TAXON_ID=1118495 /ORGANISM="Dactyliosolen fragilissimus" /LENGTH=304 /DNA_ID=CAMNT_0027363403 /DNA_START=16 /DNA_END=930 /DNA_ORIENTATION=-
MASSSTFFEKGSELLDSTYPYVFKYSEKAQKWYNHVPSEVLNLVMGVIVCFFGGLYPLFFAAIEAAKHGGMDTLVSAFQDIFSEVTKIVEASKKDDNVDRDMDGIKDVSEINNQELVMRKVKLVLKKMNPKKLDSALSSIYKVWLAVLAVLSVEFARTISLAMSISKFLDKPSQRFLKPTLQDVTPNEFDKWVPIILGWVTKSIAMSFALLFQTYISAFASALSGSLIISRSLLDLCEKKQLNLFGLIPGAHQETDLDEMLRYVFAVAGFYFQFTMNFIAPFPLNIILLPLSITEYFLRAAVLQ